jgi:hypothetical protein
VKLPANCPTRAATVQGDFYDDDFSFSFPAPFVPAHFESVAAELGLSSDGLARGANQMLKENLANNLATKIKAAAKAGHDLPTQETLDEMVLEYDFSGIRTSSGATGLSPYDKAVYKFARKLIRQILKENGYKGAPAPVTVAKKDSDEVAPGQISYADFESEVEQLAEGEGNWAEGKLAAIREKLVIAKAEKEIADNEAAAAQFEEAIKSIAV